MSDNCIFLKRDSIKISFQVGRRLEDKFVCSNCDPVSCDQTDIKALQRVFFDHDDPYIYFYIES